MTRQEEKNKARFEYVSKRLANPDYPTYNAEYELEAAFDKGAEWADAHPDIDVRTMAAWQSGYYLGWQLCPIITPRTTLSKL